MNLLDGELESVMSETFDPFGDLLGNYTIRIIGAIIDYVYQVRTSP